MTLPYDVNTNHMHDDSTDVRPTTDNDVDRTDSIDRDNSNKLGLGMMLTP